MVSIPTKDEIANLPRLAQVAFAARCARRVLPLFRHAWPDAPVAHERAVDRAVSVAEHVARTAIAGGHRGDLAASFASHVAANAPNDAGAAALAAANAAYAAANPFYAHVHAHAAAAAAAQLAAARTDMRRDFDTLQHLARVQKWTDGSTVSPEVFGPMWLNKPPDGWPGHPLAREYGGGVVQTPLPPPPVLVLVVEERSGSGLVPVRDHLLALLKAAHEYDKALGGAGFECLVEVGSGQLTLRLTPNDPAGARERLPKLADLIAEAIPDHTVTRRFAGVA